MESNFICNIKIWKQSSYSLAQTGDNKLWQSHVMEYYTAMKNIDTHIMWSNLMEIMLNEKDHILPDPIHGRIKNIQNKSR